MVCCLFWSVFKCIEDIIPRSVINDKMFVNHKFSEFHLYTVYYFMSLYAVLCTKYTNKICLNQRFAWGLWNADKCSFGLQVSVTLIFTFFH